MKGWHLKFPKRKSLMIRVSIEKRKYLTLVCLIFSINGATGQGLPLDILLLSKSDELQTIRKVSIAAELLGLRLVKANPASEHDIVQLNREHKPVALILSESNAENLQSKQLLDLLQETNGHLAGILLSSLTSDFSAYLSDLTGTTTDFPIAAINKAADSVYRVGNSEICKELAGLEFPVVFASSTIRYAFRGSVPGEPLLYLDPGDNRDQFPIFLNLAGKLPIFLETGSTINSFPTSSRIFRPRFFFELAPTMMFLYKTLNSRCYHRDADDANLTIDDPWLRESYGFLNFAALLSEMQEHNFHTTIGFIPWNFQRNQEEVMALFRNNPRYFSLCVHGNDHDRHEFGRYSGTFFDFELNKSATEQEYNIYQALARIAAMEQKTDLRVDRVMVFPHGISPEKTLAMLRRSGFNATVNRSNVPLDAAMPEDVAFYLRPVSMRYADFASFSRTIPGNLQRIAMDLFLDNPVLLYAHHGFFEDGIDSFSSFAESINRLQPNIRWRSLGDVIDRSFWKKQTGVDTYEARVFAQRAVLENSEDSAIHFRVIKHSPALHDAYNVIVEEKPYPYEERDGEILLDLTVSAGDSVTVEYKPANEAVLNTPLVERDLRVALLRHLSDFRDNRLKELPMGNFLLAYYHKTGVVLFFLSLVSILGGSTALLIVVSILHRKKDFSHNAWQEEDDVMQTSTSFQRKDIQ